MNSVKITSFAERLKEILDFKKINQSELSDMTGISRSSISDWINNKYEAKQDKIDIIATALNISQAWLMGYDVPINKSDLIEDKTHSKVQPLLRPLTQSEREILEPYNQLNTDGQNKVVDYANDLLDNEKYFEEETITYIGMAAAGNGYNYLDNIEVEQTIKKKDHPKYDFVIKVTGDSMEPKISNGSLVFVKVETDYDNGKIYVVDNDGSVYIKKVYFKDDKIVLKSINKKYDDIILQFDNVRILGEVVDWSNKDE